MDDVEQAPLAGAVGAEARGVEASRGEQLAVAGRVARAVQARPRRTSTRGRPGGRPPCTPATGCPASARRPTFSWRKRPSAVCFTGVEPGSYGIDLHHPAVVAAGQVEDAAAQRSGPWRPPARARGLEVLLAGEGGGPRRRLPRAVVEGALALAPRPSERRRGPVHARRACSALIRRLSGSLQHGHPGPGRAVAPDAQHGHARRRA